MLAERLAIKTFLGRIKWLKLRDFSKTTKATTTTQRGPYNADFCASASSPAGVVGRPPSMISSSSVDSSRHDMTDGDVVPLTQNLPLDLDKRAARIDERLPIRQRCRPAMPGRPHDHDSSRLATPRRRARRGTARGQ